jgi:hypothetical protein
MSAGQGELPDECFIDAQFDASKSPIDVAVTWRVRIRAFS